MYLSELARARRGSPVTGRVGMKAPSRSALMKALSRLRIRARPGQTLRAIRPWAVDGPDISPDQGSGQRLFDRRSGAQFREQMEYFEAHYRVLGLLEAVEAPRSPGHGRDGSSRSRSTTAIRTMRPSPHPILRSLGCRPVSSSPPTWSAAATVPARRAVRAGRARIT